MNRRNFFKILPGLLAVKEIAKNVSAPVVVEPPVTGLYAHMKKYGNTVTYKRGEFTTEKIREVFNELYFKNPPQKIWMNEAASREFNRRLRELA